MPKKLNLLHLAIVTVLSVVIGLLLEVKYHEGWLLFAGFVTGVIAVYLVAVEHIINWPIGLVNVAIYAVSFYNGSLFADSSLQVFYFVLGVQGWYFWAKGGENKKNLKISRTPKTWWPWIASSFIVGIALYVRIILHFKGPVPYYFIDSVLTVGSIIAQLLLNAKKIENWILWIAVDIAYLPLYFAKQYYSTVILYTIYLVIAVLGLTGWTKTYRAETSPIAA